MSHFAAPVTYSSAGFVARNNDALHHDLANVPGASDFELVRRLFPAPPASPDAAAETGPCPCCACVVICPPPPCVAVPRHWPSPCSVDTYRCGGRGGV